MTNTGENSGRTGLQQIAMPFLPMPAPGMPGAPFFGGENVTSFLEDWDYLCQDYHIEGKAKLERMSRYVDIVLRDQIKAMPEYIELETGRSLEKTFYDALKKYFRDQDWESLKMSRDFLMSVVRRSAEGEMGTKTFLETFNRISTTLVDRGQLAKIEQCSFFLQGLPGKYAKKIMKDPTFDADDVATWDYKKMCDTASNECKFEEKAHRFQASWDPDFSRIKEDFLNKAVHTIVQPKSIGISLPSLPLNIAAPGGLRKNPQEWNTLAALPEQIRQSTAPVSAVVVPDRTLKTSNSKLLGGTRSSEAATREDVDLLAKSFENLRVSAAAQDNLYKEIQKDLHAQTAALTSFLQRQGDSEGYRGYGYGRGGYNRGGNRGGRGGGFRGTGGQTQLQGGYAQGGQARDAQGTVDVNTVSFNAYVVYRGYRRSTDR